MRFEFSTAPRIVFGRGVISEIGELCSGFQANLQKPRIALLATNTVGGGRTLLDTLSDQGIDVIAILAQNGIQTHPFPVEEEPSVNLVQAGVQTATQSQCDLVIGLGGGSAIDTAKAIAVLLANPGDVLDYLEVIGRGKPLTQPAVPFVAVPTTAGTGAEVTANAVLASPQHRVKVSLRSALMLARIALVDPTLTYNLPPHVTASTGLDALTQVIEPFVSNKANPLTDALCREGMQKAAKSLRKAYEDGKDTAAREDMAIASLFGGMALANAKLGAVHGFAGVLGGMYHAPHGAICAALLPQVLQVNVRALNQRMPGSAYLERFDEVARILTGSESARASDGAAWVKDLAAALHVPPLGQYGVSSADSKAIIEKTAVASSTKGNPVELQFEELEEILLQSI
jgi:alcohol dehydrogenase class IV